MCGDRTMFNELDENFRHSVKLGNNTKMDVMGKGSVKLLLDGVNHVVAELPLKYNQISAFTQELKTCFIFGIEGLGCIAHVHVPEERTTELDNRSITCVLLGVSKESKDLEWGDGDGENEEKVSENGNRENIDGEVGETRDKGDGSSEGEERVRELRQSRERQPSTWMGDYEAVKSANWRLAMNNEIKSIEKNQTWTLTEQSVGAKRIGVKWVYKTKYNEHGKIDKYKAHFVAKWYSQKYGVDYTEVFALVARMDTVRMIIALAAQKNWTIFQLDVKSTFLHGELSEDVYVE
ncbi:Retrovirus-related Pol polyprotein from transposon TNT 1-94 [Vitis vinifera]|uniref:Retrovirus-related Pol polyprotein from transposon TNT 1-94 n=1 Tax=Vitis vinifera TaxID=29760 RepID=A0A438ECW0_VITVI|nr:Retrovirus-related Pol polyprotein from transposon TNT 1-94 [Vitis vinifera]